MPVDQTDSDKEQANNDKENSDTPKTGDNSAVALLLVTLLVAGTGAIGTAVYRRK